MQKKVLACLLVCASMATWVSCGSTTSNRYVYAAIPAQNEIVAYREDPNAGVLTQLVGSPITAGQAIEALVFHPSKKYLYSVNSGVNNVSLYTVSASGALSEVTPRVNAGTGPTVMAMDPAGQYLYVGNSGSFDLSVFSINAKDGTLTQVGTDLPIGISPLNMQVSPNGKFLYVTGGATPGFIEVFSVNAGALTQIGASPYATGSVPAGLVIAPSGGFLYTANKLDSTISEFAIAADGSLSPVAGSPIGLTTTGPIAMLIDKSAKYMFVACNQSPGLVLVFSIGTTGALNQISNSQIATGAQPSFIATDASGKFVFVGNQSTPQIHSFSLDTGSGILTSVAAYSLPGTATSIVATP